MNDSGLIDRDADRDLSVGDAARLVARARRVLANGELAMSARPLLFGERGVYPQFIAAAEGCRIFDTTGRAWVDWVVGWGTSVLGYRRPEIDDAVRRQLSAAPTLTMPNALEVEVAERLVDIFPGAEMVAFGKNGSDAVTAAVRLARAVTRRDVILQFGYHGFHDWFAAGDPAIRGIPRSMAGLVHAFPYNDLDALRSLLHQHDGQVAAVVMEPFRSELPRDGYLEEVRMLAHSAGALLVFDEMMTGFRVARGGAQELTGVRADLTCVGKALSNGMPLSALCGPRDLMRSADAVGVDMGCRGETLSLAAARAALDIYTSEPVAARVASIGSALREGIEAAARREKVPLRLAGNPARMDIEVDDFGRLTGRAALGLFVQGCLDRGVITNGLILPTVAHDDDSVRASIAAAEESLEIVARAAQGNTVSLPPPFGPSSIGFIDRAVVEDGCLSISGWLLPLAAPPESIEVIDDNGTESPASIGPRPDVAQAYPSIAGAEGCGWSASLPFESPSPGASWTLRARRGKRVVFRARIVAGIRSYARSFPRELRDGHVIEI
ncbi:MAG: aminotransferase class III-fold pyridoxal phosphate-dependent enzyme [Thermoanaerobaculia bacterium]